MCSPITKLPSRRLCSHLIREIKGGILMAAGDLLAQSYVEEKDWNNLDYGRIARFALIGATFTGPFLTNWSSVMRRTVSPSSGTLTKAIGKTLSTQIFMAPALNFGIITYAKLLNGMELSKTALTNILKEEFPPIMEKSCIIWFPVQFLSHIIRCPPVKLYVIHATSIVWFAHLSHLLMNNN